MVIKWVDGFKSDSKTFLMGEWEAEVIFDDKPSPMYRFVLLNGDDVVMSGFCKTMQHAIRVVECYLNVSTKD